MSGGQQTAINGLHVVKLTMVQSIMGRLMVGSKALPCTQLSPSTNPTHHRWHASGLGRHNFTASIGVGIRI